jgi:hypothetical protein
MRLESSYRSLLSLCSHCSYWTLVHNPYLAKSPEWK